MVWRGMLTRVGGYMNNRISLHAFNLKNRRIKRDVKPGECVRLFNQRVFWMRESPIPPTTEAVDPLGGF